MVNQSSRIESTPPVEFAKNLANSTGGSTMAVSQKSTQIFTPTLAAMAFAANATAAPAAGLIDNDGAVS
jgi:hypothetical protein